MLSRFDTVLEQTDRDGQTDRETDVQTNDLPYNIARQHWRVLMREKNTRVIKLDDNESCVSVSIRFFQIKDKLKAMETKITELH